MNTQHQRSRPTSTTQGAKSKAIQGTPGFHPLNSEAPCRSPLRAVAVEPLAQAAYDRINEPCLKGAGQLAETLNEALSQLGAFSTILGTQAFELGRLDRELAREGGVTQPYDEDTDWDQVARKTRKARAALKSLLTELQAVAVRHDR